MIKNKYLLALLASSNFALAAPAILVTAPDNFEADTAFAVSVKLDLEKDTVAGAQLNLTVENGDLVANSLACASVGDTIIDTCSGWTSGGQIMVAANASKHLTGGDWFNFEVKPTGTDPVKVTVTNEEYGDLSASNVPMSGTDALTEITLKAAGSKFPVTITAPAAGTVECKVDGTVIADGDQVEDGKDVECTLTVSNDTTKELDESTCASPAVAAGNVCTNKVDGAALTFALTEKDKAAAGTTFPVTITAPAVGSVECKVDGTVIADGDQVEDGKEVACTLTVSDDTTKELDPAKCASPAVAAGNVCTNKVDGGALTFALTETDKLAAGTTFAVDIVDPAPATVECKVDGAVIATGDQVENGKDVVCTLTVSDSATKEFDDTSCAGTLAANVCTTTVNRGDLTITLKEKAKGPAPVTGPAKSVPSTSFWSLVLMLTSMFGIAFMVSKEK